MPWIAVRGQGGRAQLVQISNAEMRQLQNRAAAIKRQQTAASAQQYARFRNTPSVGTMALAQAVSSAVGLATGTAGAGAFFGAALTDLFNRPVDLTIGKARSPIRAAPGLPTTGLINTATGTLVQLRSTAELVAAARAVQAAAAAAVRQPVTTYSSTPPKLSTSLSALLNGGGTGGKGSGSGGGSGGGGFGRGGDNGREQGRIGSQGGGSYNKR